MKTTVKAVSGVLGDMPGWVFFFMAALGYALVILLDKNVVFASIETPFLAFHLRFSDLLALCILLPFLGSVWKTYKKGALLNEQAVIRSLNNLDETGFRRRVCSVFTQAGFTMLPSPEGNNVPRGMIKMVQNGRVLLVLMIRDAKTSSDRLEHLFETMVTEGVGRGLVLSTGLFSRSARRFARNSHILTVDGPGFLILLNQQGPSVAESDLFFADTTRTLYRMISDLRPRCSQCNAVMNLTLRKTRGPGGQTRWCCSRYPACRHNEIYSLPTIRL